MESVTVRGAPRWRAMCVPLSINLLLPLAVYYALRTQDVAEWRALLLSGAIPAAHVLVTAVVRRRVDFFDVLVVVLLAASAATSLISGSPRLLLLKDAGIPAALGVWLLGSLCAPRPVAFQLWRRLRGPEAEAETEAAWRELPDFRAALRGLTLLWGGSQVLDAVLSLVETATLPVDWVPVIGRLQSLAILATMAALTVHRSRPYRDGLPPRIEDEQCAPRL